VQAITGYREFSKITDDFGLRLFEKCGFDDLAQEALDETEGRHKKNCALKAPLVMSFVVMMSLHRHLSLPNVLMQMVNMLREKAPDLPLKPVTSEAVIHARTRLGIEPMKILAEKIGMQVDPKPSFHGLRTWAIDGLRNTVPDTPENEAYFERPKTPRSKAAFPQMLAVALVDTESRGIRDAVYFNCRGSERTGCEALLKHLDEKDILILDRGFPSAPLLESISSKGIHFLARISGSWKPRVLRRLGPGDLLVEITGRKEIPPEERDPTKKYNKTRLVKLTVRMIEYRTAKNELVRVLTDLVDEVEISALEFAHLYHVRWESELSFDEVKTHLATVTHGSLHTVFRCKSPDKVKQEAYGLLIAYNMIRALIREAGEAHSIPQLDISFVDTLQVIRLALPRSERADTPEQRCQLLRQLLQDIAGCRNPRPRRGRTYPRVVKLKMSKWPLKRAKHRQEFHDYQVEIQIVESAPEAGI
jgi:hypothetical protein